MNRYLTTLPANPSLAQLRTLSEQFFAHVDDVNVVTIAGTPNLAVYVEDNTDPAAWAAAVARWTPTHPTPEETAATNLTDDAAADAFIRARFPAVLAKAQAIRADPVNAPAFTAAEAKVIQAVVVLDVAKRFR